MGSDCRWYKTWNSAYFFAWREKVFEYFCRFTCDIKTVTRFRDSKMFQFYFTVIIATLSIFVIFASLHLSCRSLWLHTLKESILGRYSSLFHIYRFEQDLIFTWISWAWFHFELNEKTIGFLKTFKESFHN